MYGIFEFPKQQQNAHKTVCVFILNGDMIMPKCDQSVQIER